jgi:hypothetical protein
MTCEEEWVPPSVRLPDALSIQCSCDRGPEPRGVRGDLKTLLC